MERGELMLRLKQSSEGHGPIQAAGKWRVMRSSSSKHPCGLNHGGGGGAIGDDKQRSPVWGRG